MPSAVQIKKHRVEKHRTTPASIGIQRPDDMFLSPTQTKIPEIKNRYAASTARNVIPANFNEVIKKISGFLVMVQACGSSVSGMQSAV